MAKKRVKRRSKKRSSRSLVRAPYGGGFSGFGGFGGFDPTPYLISASRRKLDATLTATCDDSGMTVSPTIAPIPITPTLYPESPAGTVIVQNFITINIKSTNFKTFNATMDALVRKLVQSNEISGEVRAQLLSEMTAGRELLKGPKPSRECIENFLMKPLKFLARTVTSTTISESANKASDVLLKMME